MKKLLLIFLAICAISLFSSCNKDDDDMMDVIDNEFTFDGMTYELGKCLFQDIGSNGNGSFDLDIYMVSSSISPGGSFGLTGTGETLFLDLNTSEATGLVAGTYNWSNSREALTIVPGSNLRVGFDWDNATSNTIEITDGTVTIALEGTEATITFNLTTSDGKTVVGEWKGVPRNF